MYDYDFIAREDAWTRMLEAEADERFVEEDAEWEEDLFWADGDEDAEDLDWDEGADLEMGYNPYMGCYDWDC